MKSHLQLKIDGVWQTLKPDQKLSIEDPNPLWNDVSMWSQPFQLPFRYNRELLGNADDVNSDLRAPDFDHKSAIIYAEGMPFRSAVTNVQEGEKMDGDLTINLDASRRSFDQLIGDLNCQDIPIKDRIQIGEKIANCHIEVDYDYRITVEDKCDDGSILNSEITNIGFAKSTGTVTGLDAEKNAHLVLFDDLSTPRAISFKAKLEVL